MTISKKGGRPTGEQLEKRNAQKEEFLKAYEKYYAKNHLTCKMQGIGINTFHRWCQEDPEFAAQVKNIHLLSFDVIEYNLIGIGTGQVQGNPTALVYYLNNKANVYDGWGYKNNRAKFKLPDKLETVHDINKAFEEVMMQVADGKISLEVAEALNNMLKTKLDVIQKIDLENKIAELEKIALEGKTT